jgi:hypothetical protein
MKKENILKGIRLMTFILVAGFISFNAHAGDKENNLRNMNSGEGQKTEDTQSQQIELEEWMLDMSNFTVIRKESNAFNLNTQVEAETEIQFEDWMLNRERFMTSEEREMNKIEDWMTNESNFRTQEEQEMNRIEEWMVDSDIWKI